MRFRSLIGKTKGRFVSEKRWKREREIVERRINKLGQEMRKAIRARDAARSPKIKAKWQAVIDKARPKQQKELQGRGGLERQGEGIPKGRRVEVSLRFKSETAKWLKNQHRNRLRMLKVSVEVKKRGITKAEVERAVEDAIRSGRKPKGMILRVADWGASRKVAGKIETSSGRLVARKGLSLHEQLKPFAGLLRRDTVSRREVSDVGAKRASRTGAKSSKKRRAR
jgi:hypothetical protein